MNIITSSAHFRQRVIKKSYKSGVTFASNYYHVSRNAIYEWRHKWDGTVKSLRDKSHRPHHHPNEHTESEKEMILKRSPYYNEENQTDSDDTAPLKTEEDRNLRTKQERKSVQTPVGLVSLKLFAQLARMIFNDLEYDDTEHAFADKKLMQKTAQKKLVQGQMLG